MAKWHLIKKPVLRDVFRPSHTFVQKKEVANRYTRKSPTLKFNDNTIGPVGVVYGLSLLFTIIINRKKTIVKLTASNRTDVMVGIVTKYGKYCLHQVVTHIIILINLTKETFKTEKRFSVAVLAAITDVCVVC